jgi:hypothetical protein
MNYGRINNIDVRELIKEKRLRHYEVAAACGVSEYTFSQWLRTELPPDKKERIIKAIKGLSPGVVIRGMKMPSSCHECDFFVNIGHGDECFFEGVAKYYGFPGEWPKDKRHKDCPLTEANA